MLKERRASTIMYTTYDNKYHIRQKHGVNDTNFWIVAECGNILEKTFIGSLNECKEYIYNNLTADNGHKYKLEHISELSVLTYSRIKVNCKAKIAQLALDKKLFLDVKIENISSGGCKVILNNELNTNFNVNDTILVHFNLSEFDIKEYDKLELEAEVRWIESNGKEFGCKFKELDERSDKIFSRILEKFLL